MKVKIDNYLFDASAKTVKFLDYDTIDLERILLITNVTDNIIIYSFADTTKGGSVSNDILTLDYNTTSMADSDKLLIFYQEEDNDNIIDIDGKTKALIVDKNVGYILSQILIELKKINIQLELITETKVEEGDI